ncbi:hypothetical protein [Halarchaeum sp. P4]|uniref:hypothetical protein n=1 Tax=Halarchaeum sp. P4 TaxID=3421639 RepID=UPI003EBFCDA4
MSEDSDQYTPPQFREHQEEKGHREPFARRHTGLTRDPALSRFLSVLDASYDPVSHAETPGKMPGNAMDTDLARTILQNEATEVGREALDNGDMATLKHLTGDAGQQADVSGLKAMQTIDELIESPAPVIVVLGEMGAGKTDFACLLAQRARHLLGVDQVASNIQSLRETTDWTDVEGEHRDGFVPDYPTLEEWVQQDGDPLTYDQQQKLFIGDEFSSHADGTGKSGHLTRKLMGPLVYKIRKYDGMLIYIAHDESSIHPLLWRLGVIVKKTAQKTAVVADRVKGGELRGIRTEITGIPPTDWRYNTKEASDWAWTDDEEKEDPSPDEIARDVAIWTVHECQRMGLSYRETAQYVPFAKSWVGDRAVELENGEHDAALDRVRAITS